MKRAPNNLLKSSDSSLKSRVGPYIRLMRIDKPIGYLLLLWPALWALWMASGGRPRWSLVLIFMAGVVLMRSAGCAINDYADRNIDGDVKRTSNRPLVTGEIKPVQALIVFVVCSLLAFALVLQLNEITIYMSFVAVALAAVYPFMKRYTHLPQLVLGAAFGWAVPMAFTATTGSVPPVGWLLFMATVVWAMIYDTEYAMIDREDDVKIGVKSTAILFGEYDRVLIGLMQVIMLIMMIQVGAQMERGWVYFLGLGVAALFALRQQVLIREREPTGCFAAFINNNCFGMAIFLGILLDYLMFPVVPVTS